MKDPVEAQAVPDLPVAWLYEAEGFADAFSKKRLPEGSLSGRIKETPLFTRPTPAAAPRVEVTLPDGDDRDLRVDWQETKPDGTIWVCIDVGRPTPAAADLHQQYVYVRLIRPEGYEDVHPELLVADAHIHPAFEPEIVAASPAAAADWKLVPIEPTKEMLGAICEAEFLRKPANAVYAAVLAASPVALNIRDNSQYQRNPQMMPIETAPKGGSFLAKDEHGWEVWNADAYWSAIAADAPAHMPRNEARALTHWHPLPGASYAAAAALQQQFHHETWWLLESTVTPRPCYYAGPRRAPRDNRVIDGITENANKAVRFSDESAAKLMVAMLADVDTSKPTWPLEAATKGCWKASEHMFDYTPRTKEQE